MRGGGGSLVEGGGCGERGEVDEGLAEGSEGGPTAGNGYPNVHLGTVLCSHPDDRDAHTGTHKNSTDSFRRHRCSFVKPIRAPL